MKTPIFAISVLFFSCLWRIAALQVPVRRVYNNNLTEFRLPRAIQLLRYMNQSIDPCTDFYEFACGNWPNHHPTSEDTPITSPTELLREKVLKDLQVLLEERVTVYDGNVGRRVKDFYASCVDAERASQSLRVTFSNFVKRHGGMPAVDKRWNENNYSWLLQIANLRRDFGLDVIIGLNIKPDYLNMREGRIYIGEPSTMIPQIACKTNSIDENQYQELEQAVIDNMAYWFDMGEIEARRLASEIIDFEVTLCRGMITSNESINMPLPKKQLHSINLQFPSIDFHTFVTTSLGQPIHQTVYMENELYFANLTKLMRVTSKRVVANYVMYRALEMISFTDESDPQKRAQLCTEKTVRHFPKVVGELYHRKYFREEIVKEVEELWVKLKEGFRQDVNQHSWIEENFRRQAIYKVNEMQLRSPTYQKDVLNTEYNTLKIDKALFWENIQNLLDLEQKHRMKKLHFDGTPISWGDEIEAADINIGYSATQNLIRLPIALLQPPVYHRSAPAAYKFGVLLFLTARELIHAFDMSGSHYDGTPRAWSDEDSYLLYKERAKCFSEQYESYVSKSAELPPTELDDRIREFVSDTAALNTSFSAYLIWLQKTTELHLLYDETLSDVDYSSTQLFFIAFAQNYCTATYSPPEENEEVVSSVALFPWDEPNRAEKFKVNGPLSNMREFAREFNCQPGAEMNPADKCFIY